ncbi:MAG: hypothetical protein ABIZ56_03640 [Chthoniobacteraceae bacterium]
MSTITVLLEPDADGTLHLRLPKAMWRSKVRVVATPLEDEPADGPLAPEVEAAVMKAIQQLREHAGLQRRELPPEELARRREAARDALRRLRESNPYLDLADPVAWQREIREDRRLPFRD